MKTLFLTLIALFFASPLIIGMGTAIYQVFAHASLYHFIVLSILAWISYKLYITK